MDFIVFFSCISVAIGIIIILFGSDETQLTKGITVTKHLQIASYIIGVILIILGILGFYIGLRGVFKRHREHLKKVHERDQKRKETNLRV